MLQLLLLWEFLSPQSSQFLPKMQVSISVSSKMQISSSAQNAGFYFFQNVDFFFCSKCRFQFLPKIQISVSAQNAVSVSSQNVGFYFCPKCRFLYLPKFRFLFLKCWPKLHSNIFLDAGQNAQQYLLKCWPKCTAISS